MFSCRTRGFCSSCHAKQLEGPSSSGRLSYLQDAGGYSFDDERLVEIFAREVLADLVRKELLSPEWAERILSWRHTGFNVHSLVQTSRSRLASLIRNS